jgi:hypothetical protein
MAGSERVENRAPMLGERCRGGHVRIAGAFAGPPAMCACRWVRVISRPAAVTVTGSSGNLRDMSGSTAWLRMVLFTMTLACVDDALCRG